MPELHLKQPGFTYGACEPFTEHREGIRKFRETSNLKHLYRNKLDKAHFAHDAAYSDVKDLAKTIVSDEILRLLKVVNMVDIKEQLAEGLHKPLTKKFKERKVYARFKDNI